MINNQSWLDRISIDPNIHHGDPCIKETRVSVSVIVGSVADGDTIDRIIASYPQLKRDSVQAALHYNQGLRE